MEKNEALKWRRAAGKTKGSFLHLNHDGLSSGGSLLSSVRASSWTEACLQIILKIADFCSPRLGLPNKYGLVVVLEG